jgi:TonB-linked SusC/RagA family outer membrane protein
MENYLNFFRARVRKKSKIMRFMKLTMILLLVGMMQVSASVYSQNGKINVEVNEMELSELLWQLQESSGIVFVYRTKDLRGLDKVTVTKQDASMEEILDEVLENTDLEYVLNEDVVTIKRIVQSEQDPDNESYKVKGEVVDDRGNVMPGVSVVVQGTMRGTVTDIDGEFEIMAKKTDALTFSFIGYKTETVLIKGQSKIEHVIMPEAQAVGEVVVTADGRNANREAMSGSFSTIRTDNLKNNSGNLTQNLAGAVPGLFAWTSHGIPSALTDEEIDTKFYIRSITSFQENANINPLVLLDGVEASILDLSRIDPDDIASFTVMKDASATAMYGARGANGVIYVRTKKGKDGDMRTTFKVQGIWSMPTDKIDLVDGIEYMKLYNEALMSRDPNATPRYSAERIRRAQSGNYPDWVYPNTDWIKKVFKPYTFNKHYTLNVRGGTKKVQYYSSIGFNMDSGNIKTDKLNQFDANIDNKRITFRTNLNIKLTRTAKLNINTFSTFDKNHTPMVDPNQLYDRVMYASQIDYAPTYPADEMSDYPHIRFGGHNSNSVNPYKDVHEGYKDRRRFSTVDKIELIQTLDNLTKGLEFRASASMYKEAYFQNALRTKPAMYRLESYNDVDKTHTLTALNKDEARRTLKYDQSNSYMTSFTTMTYEAKLMHTRQWDANNSTTIVGLLNARERNNSFITDVHQSIPERNLGYSMSFSYSRKNKYYADFSFGYNGSERFAKNNRMGFFPAFGAGWIISKEDWMISTAKWLNYLKVRGSYGFVGNDGVIKHPRFVYLESLHSGMGPTFGPGGQGATGATEIESYANRSTKWEVAEQANVGLEAKLFRGLVDFTAEAYQEVRHNIYDLRYDVPSTVGLGTPPLDNVGKVRSRGLEFQLKLQKAFSKDFYILVNSTLSFNKAKFMEVEEPQGIPEWQKRTGKEISQQFGYISEGLFRDEAEIANSPTQSGNVMPGDIKYRDIDGDGKITTRDAVAIGLPRNPRLIYGASIFAHYKGWEFSMAFQGLGQTSFWVDPDQVGPLQSSRAVLKSFAKDHWSLANQDPNAMYPRFTLDGIRAHNPEEVITKDHRFTSTFFMRNGSFLRCKNIELAKYLKLDFMKKARIEKIKVYARASNPFVFSKFKLWDPELKGNGLNYPIQKSYALGVNVSF